MKVLMTADTLGGVWTFALELARALAPRGVRTALATLGAPLSPRQWDEAKGVPGLDVHEGRWKLEWMDNPWADVEASGRWLLDVERRVRPDVVHLNGTMSHAALPWRAPVVVTNNTGTSHVASALKRPVVTVFAGTNPAEQWGPWRTPNRLLTHPVPCAPCYKRVCPIGHECLTGIAPGSVVDAALRLLHESLSPAAEVLR